MKQAPPLSEHTMRLALFLVRVTPRWLGYPLARWAGRLYARLFPQFRAIVESNLEPVLGTSDPRRLRRVAVEAFATAAQAYYELLYMPFMPREAIATLAQFREPGWTQFQEAYREGQGIVIAAPHMSSFDLAGQALVAQGYNLLVLALPDQAEGFAFMNKMRAFQQGSHVTPVGPAALFRAVRTLKGGGIVVTGGDRPIRGQGTVVEFFGRPTLLPDGHVRLALRTGAALFMTPCQQERGQYWVSFRRLELTRSGDDEADVREGTQRFAQAMEPVIRAHPEQWHLLIRLWQE